MSAERVRDKVQETAKEEFDRIRYLTTDAAKSGAYLYPFRVDALVWIFKATILTRMLRE